MNDPFIKTEHLNFSYRTDDGGEVEVLHDLSLEVERGSLVAILGHNGSGKSTLAKLLNLILTPKSGRITIDGLEITSPDLTEDQLFENRRKVGMVFQNPDNQLVATIVEEDVAFGPENLGIPSDEIRKRVDEALETVGMTKYRRHSPHQLSGGQKQRVAIAGIIAMTPECIIFDESTAMLDPRGRKEVMDTIRKLNRELGITILHITHYMNEAALCDRVVVIDDGRVRLDGKPEEVFTHVAELHEIGLDVPQPTELLYELKLSGVRGKDGKPLPLGVLDANACADEIMTLFEGKPLKPARSSKAIEPARSDAKSIETGSAKPSITAQTGGKSAEAGQSPKTAETAQSAQPSMTVQSGVKAAEAEQSAKAADTEQSPKTAETAQSDGESAETAASRTDIELRNVSYIYSPDTPFKSVALDNVSLTIRGGRITGLMGHTGSGKSTLVGLLNGLNRPSSGQVFVGGEDIWADPKKISRFAFKVGLVFQYPEYQLFEETVRKDIAFGPTNMGLSEDEVARRVADAAAFCGLSDELLDKSPFDLSGGQKRRVAIAGIMAMEPEVLVLDEPAAGLDPRGREEILGGIRSYQRRRNSSVIIVSHSMEDMARYSDEIIVMDHAKVKTQGTTAEIFEKAEELVSVGLDVPAITEVTDLLSERGLPVKKGLYTVDAARDAVLSLLGKNVAERTGGGK